MSIRSLLTRRFLIFLVGWSAVVAMLGEVVARQRAETVARSARDESAGQAALIARTLSQSLETARGIALTFRSAPAVAALLDAIPSAQIERMTDSTARRVLLSVRPDVAALSMVMAENVRAISVLDALYLQDAQGLIVASGDHNMASSRIGRRFVGQAFLRRLAKEDVVQIYAPSLLTGRPGFLFGASILKDTRVIGSVVARVEADTITRTLSGVHQTLVLVTDSAGRVLASSDPRQVLRRIDLPGAVDDTSVARLPTVAGSLGALYAGPVGHSDLRRAWVTVPLDEFGLSLHVVRRLTEAQSQLNAARLIALLVWVAGIVLLIANARGVQQLADVANAQRLAEAEQRRVADILNTSYDAVITLDSQQHVVDWNVRAEAIFGYKASEMVGTNPIERIVPQRWRGKHAAGFENAVRVSRSDNLGTPRDLTALNRSGLEFPVELTVSTARDADGGLLFVAFFRDVSTRRQEEEARAAVSERTERYRTVLLEFSQRTKIEWDQTLRHLLREAKRAVGVGRASFWRLDAQIETMTCEVMLDADAEDTASSGLQLSRAETPRYFRVLRLGQPIAAANAVTHEATRDFAESYLVPNGVGSVLDTPVWFEGRQIGVFSLEHRGKPRAWEPDTVEFASTIASQIGLLQESVRRVASERALDEEREQAKRVLSSTPVAQVVWETQEGLASANPAAVTLFRYPSEGAMKGKFPWDLSPPEQAGGESSRAKGAEYVARCMAEGSASFEWIFSRADGDTFPASVTLVRLTESGSQRLSTIIDLSAQKAAEAAVAASAQALQEAREQLGLALRSANMGTWKFVVPEGRLEADENTKSLYGLQDVELDGTMAQWFTFIHPDDLAPLGQVMQETMALQRADYRATFRVCQPDGSVRHIMSVGKFSYAADGTATVANGVVWDITDLKNAEEAVRHVSFLSDQALDLTNAGYWHVPLDGSGWYNSSERACRVFGDIPRDGYRYRIMEDWFANVEAGDKAASERTMVNFTAAVEGRIPKYDSIYAYKRPIDGRIVWIHALGHVVSNASGTPTDMYGVTVDITDTKMLEDELRAAAASAGEVPAVSTGRRVDA